MNADSARWTLLRHGEFGNQNLCKGGNTKKMKKKTLTIAIALVLVVALAVGATWAYLTAQSGPVTNTFTAGKAVASDNLKLYESKAVQGTDGTYTLGADKVNGNTYTVMPGVNLPKDPTVEVMKADGPYYLFVEVTKGDQVGNNDTTKALSYKVDGTNWTLLEINGKEVYAYTNGGAAAAIMSAPVTAKVLAGDTITVSGEEALTSALTAASANLTFKAYACQAAGFTSAVEAFNTCFGSTGA